MQRLVLDTSVVLKWYRQEEELADKALLVREAYSEGNIEIVAPDYVLCEFANVLRYKTDLSIQKVQGCIQHLTRLDIRWVIPETKLLERAIEIARSRDISVYDAIFVATAEKYRAKVVTADKRFVDDAGNRGDVYYLGDVDRLVLD